MLQRITRREAVVLERIELEHLQMNPERLQVRPRPWMGTGKHAP